MKERPHHTWDPSAPAPRFPRRFSATGDVWAGTKQIDELGGEWSYGVFVARALNFHLAPILPVQFYEPVQNFERAALDAHLIYRARNFGLRDDEIGNLTVEYTAFPSVFNPVDGHVPVPEHDEHSIGRHSATVLAADADGLVIAHGWSGWTPTKTAVMPREYANRYLCGGLLSRRWDRGPLPGSAVELLDTSDPLLFRELWRSPRKRGFEFRDVPGGKTRLAWFETWGMQLEQRAEVLTLQVGRNIRAGVAVLALDEETASISDLFVWPPYRQKGYGRVLEQFCAERARSQKSRQLEIYLWEADAVRGEQRARAFMSECGYSITDLSQSEATARGVRELRRR